MALIELSRMIAADPDAGRRWAAEPLPLPDRLTAIMAAQYSALPGQRNPRCCSPRPPTARTFPAQACPGCPPAGWLPRKRPA